MSLAEDPAPPAARPALADIELEFAVAWAALAAVHDPLTEIIRVTVLPPVGTGKAAPRVIRTSPPFFRRR
jgi:hypothetical protein